MYQILQINDQLLEKYLKPLRKLLIICFICTFSFFLYSQNALPKEYIIEVIVFEQLKINDNEDLQPELLNISTLKSIGLSTIVQILVAISGFLIMISFQFIFYRDSDWIIFYPFR